MDKETIKAFQKAFKKAESIIVNDAYCSIWGVESPPDPEEGWVFVEENSCGFRLYYNSVKVEKALKFLQEAEKYIDEDCLEELRVEYVWKVYDFYGRIAFLKQEWETALKKYHQAKDLYLKYNLFPIEAYQHIGKVLCIIDKRDEASEMMDEVTEVSKSLFRYNMDVIELKKEIQSHFNM